MCATVPHFSPLRNTFGPFFPTSWGTTPPRASAGRTAEARRRHGQGYRRASAASAGRRPAAETAGRVAAGGGDGWAWERGRAGRRRTPAPSGYCLGTTILCPTTRVLLPQIRVERLELGMVVVSKRLGDARERVAGLAPRTSWSTRGREPLALVALAVGVVRSARPELITPDWTTMPMRAITATRKTIGSRDARHDARRNWGLPRDGVRERGARWDEPMGRCGRLVGGRAERVDDGRRRQRRDVERGRRSASAEPIDSSRRRAASGSSTPAGSGRRAGAPSGRRGARTASPLVWCLVGHRLSWRSLRIDSAAAAAALR